MLQLAQAMTVPLQSCHSGCRSCVKTAHSHAPAASLTVAHTALTLSPSLAPAGHPGAWPAAAPQLAEQVHPAVRDLPGAPRHHAGGARRQRQVRHLRMPGGRADRAGHQARHLAHEPQSHHCSPDVWAHGRSDRCGPPVTTLAVWRTLRQRASRERSSASCSLSCTEHAGCVLTCRGCCRVNALLTDMATAAAHPAASTP